jgi:DNA-binding CsgD family transcriptional regulator
MLRSIRADDARAMLRFLNELHEMPAADPLARKRHLLRTLCCLLGAKVGAIVYLADGVGPRWQFRSPVVVDYGWPCERERGALVAYRDDAARSPDKYADPMEAMLKLSGTVVTCRRAELHSDRAWYSRGHINEYRRPARVDDCVYTLYRLPQHGAMVGLGMHRDWGDRRRFGLRERDLLHLLNGQLECLWRCDVTGETEALPPRLRQTLCLLMRGHSEKEIAARLDVSRNTVHKYVTALYRRFTMTSRAELMARQTGGGAGGGDFPDVAGDASACNEDWVN